MDTCLILLQGACVYLYISLIKLACSIQFSSGPELRLTMNEKDGVIIP